MLNPNMANATPAELKALLLGLLQSNPDVLADFVKESDDAQRLLKKSLPKAAPRSTSFMQELWPVALCALAESFGIEADSEDEDAYKAILSVIDSKIEGTQDACTYEYSAGGRIHKVRLTILSEDNNAAGTLDKAIQVIAEAGANDFADLSAKYRKRVQSARVDEQLRKEQLAAYDAAVASRRAAFEAEVPEPAAPPVPPA